jgi:hypothetical protein
LENQQKKNQIKSKLSTLLLSFVVVEEMGKQKNKQQPPSAMRGLKESSFKKKKTKVGKKVVQNTNTDTTFKTRSILVPSQTFRDDSLIKDSGVATTHRRLALKDLLSQLKHHNKSVRKGK